MLYDITATITYRYDAPAVAGRTLLRLMPRTIEGVQRLIAGRIEAQPAPAERLERDDFFGNRVTELTFRGAADTARFHLVARVERTGTVPELDLSPPLSRLAEELALPATLGPEAPHHFLGPSPRIAPDPAIAAFAQEAAPAGAGTLATLTAVGAAINRTMRFDPRATTVDTDPAAAFAARRGVCQDFSHVLIAALRSLGVPAAYVSGYLRTIPPPGQPRLAGADAMHAWVRAWCGIEIGWVDYDPTNDCLVAGDHVVVAVGRDYDDIAPVRGVLRTAGGQISAQEVDVVPVG
jgi:transglutaminase-like putative cysteine protease